MTKNWTKDIRINFFERPSISFVTKNCKKYPRQNLGYHCDKELEQKFVINKILEYLSLACVLPREGQMRRRIIRARWIIIPFFSPKTKRATKLSRSLFGQKVLTMMYDRDTLHVATTARKKWVFVEAWIIAHG